MNAISTARRQLKADPTSPASRILSSLVLALESDSDSSFDLSSLYELDLKSFELALAVLQDWRLNRYAVKKTKLLNISRFVQGLEAAPSAPESVDDSSK